MPDRVSLFDRLGTGFTLLCLNGERELVAPLVTAARDRGVPLTTLTIDMPDARALYECDYALLRPDQVVVWRGNHIPEDGAPLIARVAGW